MTSSTAAGNGHVGVECDDIQFDRNRAAVLEFLYELDGRGSGEHPQHHTYTQLAENFKLAVGQLVLDELTRGWHLSQRPVIKIDFGADDSGAGG